MFTETESHVLPYGMIVKSLLGYDAASGFTVRHYEMDVNHINHKLFPPFVYVQNDLVNIKNKSNLRVKAYSNTCFDYEIGVFAVDQFWFHFDMLGNARLAASALKAEEGFGFFIVPHDDGGFDVEIIY